MKPKIVVIGSANMDMIIRTADIPKAGETYWVIIYSIQGWQRCQSGNYCGCLGADVSFVAAWGGIHLGKMPLKPMKKRGLIRAI